MNLRAIIPCTLILWLGGCVSTMDLGGDVVRYTASGYQVAAAQRMWQIPDVCFSACTMKAAFARPYACLGPQSELGFHAVRGYDGQWHTNPALYYPADLTVALEARGGLPITDSPTPAPAPRGAYWMPRETALKFWPACGDKT